MFGFRGPWRNCSTLAESFLRHAEIMHSSSSASGSKNSNISSCTCTGADPKTSHRLESRENHLPRRVFAEIWRPQHELPKFASPLSQFCHREHLDQELSVSRQTLGTAPPSPMFRSLQVCWLRYRSSLKSTCLPYKLSLKFWNIWWYPPFNTRPFVSRTY